MKLVISLIIIWVVGSCIYGAKTNQSDTKPLAKEFELFKSEHPILTLAVLVVVVLIVIGILF